MSANSQQEDLHSMTPSLTLPLHLPYAVHLKCTMSVDTTVHCCQHASKQKFLLSFICSKLLFCIIKMGGLAMLTDGGYLTPVPPLCTEGQHKGLQKDW